MSQQQVLLKRLRKELKTKSTSQVAVAMGYRSQSTIAYWLKQDRIPTAAEARVRRYFARNNA